MFQLTETVVTLRPTVKSKEDEISNTDRTSYTRQAKSLIVECLKLRKKALQTGQEKYVVALNSYIRALARLMKQVREPTFDKEQVEEALQLLKNKVTEVKSVLEQSISTEKTSVPRETVGVTTMSVSEVRQFLYLYHEYGGHSGRVVTLASHL